MKVSSLRKALKNPLSNLICWRGHIPLTLLAFASNHCGSGINGKSKSLHHLIVLPLLVGMPANQGRPFLFFSRNFPKDFRRILPETVQRTDCRIENAQESSQGRLITVMRSLSQHHQSDHQKEQLILRGWLAFVIQGRFLFHAGFVEGVICDWSARG